MKPYQQSFQINVGTQSLNINFTGANRQFVFLEVSLVCSKRDQHKTCYSRYNLEVAAQKIKSLKIGNASSTYALTNEIKYDVDGVGDAYWLYLQFVALLYNGCTVAPLTEYANNLIYQDLTKADSYFSSDKTMYLDLRRSKGYNNELKRFTRDKCKLTLNETLKDTTNKKMRFRVTRYSQGQYYYALSSRGQIIQYKNYRITKNNNIAA